MIFQTVTLSEKVVCFLERKLMYLWTGLEMINKEFHFRNLKFPINIYFRYLFAWWNLVGNSKRNEAFWHMYFSHCFKKIFSYHKVTWKICKAMRISKYMVGFDEDYFDFLQDELWTLNKDFREKFGKIIVKNSFVFNLLDVSLKKFLMVWYHSSFIAIVCLLKR